MFGIKEKKNRIFEYLAFDVRLIFNVNLLDFFFIESVLIKK